MSTLRSSLLAVLGVIALAGCSEPVGKPVALFIGIDTSGSAEAEKGRFYKQVLDANKRVLAAPTGSQIEIYRFDDTVHEIHVGDPIEQPAQLAQKLRDAINPAQAQTGTNLWRLLQTVDGRLSQESGKDVKLLVLTDCGTELMTPKEFDEMQKLAERWSKDGTVGELRISGLRPLHRDLLRKRLNSLGKRLILE